MRVTKTQLRATVERLQRAHFNIAIHWAYGQPRCTTLDEGSDLSPRLAMGEMDTWLSGFEAGAQAEEHRQCVLAAMEGN
jgi:hypothetical protein